MIKKNKYPYYESYSKFKAMKKKYPKTHVK